MLRAVAQQAGGFEVASMPGLGSVEMLRSAIQDPYSPGALNNLAVAEYQQGKLHAAIAPGPENI